MAKFPKISQKFLKNFSTWQFFLHKCNLWYLWQILALFLADPLRTEIGHRAFLAPARLACTTTPAVFNFGDFWLELAVRMVSTGLNQGGGGVSDHCAKFDPAWTELGGWDNSRYVWILHTGSGSAAFAVDPSQLSPRYTMLLGGGRLGWEERAIRPNIRQLDATLLRGIVTHQLLCYSSSSWPFQEGVLCFFCIENIKCLID